MVYIKKAIILVAGMGTRLKPLTLVNHKCLTEVNKTPILVNTLKILSECGFEQVVIVVGYLKHLIYERIGNKFDDMEITYAENDIYDKTNTSWSLKLGLEKTINYNELYIIEGDVFFEKKLMEDLILYKEKNVTVLEHYNPDLDGTFAEIGENNFVIDWTHKTHRKPGYIVENKYKTVNIHKFSLEFINSILNNYLNKNIDLYNGKEPFENVMEIIVHNNPDMIKGMVLDGQKWFEIDNQDDLKKAEIIFN